MTQFCVIVGKLAHKPINVKAYVLGEIRWDIRGRRIDLLFGAPLMQEWNIIVVPKERRHDLSQYPKEFSSSRPNRLREPRALRAGRQLVMPDP